MKKKDFIKRLSEMTGLEPDKVVEYINSDNEEIEGLELPELSFFTEDELSAKLKNHANSSSKTFIEMAVKDARNKYDLVFEGKNMDNLVVAAMEKARDESKEEIENLKKKPNEQLLEKDKIIEGLRDSVKKIETEKQNEVERLTASINKMKSDNFINSVIPTNLDTPLSQSDVSVLFRNDHGIKEENGVMVFTDKQGNVLRNEKTQDPLKSDEVVNNWLTMKNITIKDVEGRGGDNDAGNIGKLRIKNIKTTNDFNKYCKENNIPDRERHKALIEIRKENPEFILE